MTIASYKQTKVGDGTYKAVIEVTDGYAVKDALKARGYQYQKLGREGVWSIDIGTLIANAKSAESNKEIARAAFREMDTLTAEFGITQTSGKQMRMLRESAGM